MTEKVYSLKGNLELEWACDVLVMDRMEWK